MKEESCIDLKLAIEAASEVIKVAKETEGDPVAVTVAGENGVTIVTLRMDRSAPMHPELSQQKAWTVYMTRKPTLDWQNMWKKEGYEPVNSMLDIFFRGGGVPVTLEGKLLGYIGVSGRNSQDDHKLAETGANWLVKKMNGKCKEK